LSFFFWLLYCLSLQYNNQKKKDKQYNNQTKKNKQYNNQ
jgi:preprotein translocase subunit SecG